MIATNVTTPPVWPFASQSVFTEGQSFVVSCVCVCVCVFFFCVSSFFYCDLKLFVVVVQEISVLFWIQREVPEILFRCFRWPTLSKKSLRV